MVMFQMLAFLSGPPVSVTKPRYYVWGDVDCSQHVCAFHVSELFVRISVPHAGWQMAFPIVLQMRVEVPHGLMLGSALRHRQRSRQERPGNPSTEMNGTI